MTKDVKLRRFFYVLHTLTHTFENFSDLAEWLRRQADNYRNSAAVARTQKDARFLEGKAEGLREAADIVHALQENPDYVRPKPEEFVLSEEERKAVMQLRNGTHVLVGRMMTLGEFFDQEEAKARQRYEAEKK